MTENKLLGTIEAWIEASLGIREDDRAWYDKRLLKHIIEGQHHMALQLQALTDAAAKLGSDGTALKTSVDALIALHTDPSQQAAIDAVATALTGVSTALETVTAAVNAVVNPPAPPAA